METLICLFEAFFSRYWKKGKIANMIDVIKKVSRKCVPTLI